MVLKKLAPGAEDAEPVFQIPVSLPCLKRGRLVKKNIMPYMREKSIPLLFQNLSSGPPPAYLGTFVLATFKNIFKDTFSSTQ